MRPPSSPRGDLTRAHPSTGPRELAELGCSFNEMADNLAPPLRHPSRARDVGEPRPANAPREHAGDARSDRGRLAGPRSMCRRCASRCGLSPLVDDLFELARIDTGVLTLELRGCRSHRSCRVGSRASRQKHEAGMFASTPTSTPTSPARFAPDKVERVLLNLLDECAASHAIRRHGRRPRRPTPRRGARRRRGHGRRDSIERRARMFERFWRGDQSRSARAERGSGSPSRAASSRHTADASGRRTVRRRRACQLHAADGLTATYALGSYRPSPGGTHRRSDSARELARRFSRR